MPNEGMIEFAGDSLPTPPIEVERCTITAERVADFLRHTAPQGGVADRLPAFPPISFALALRSEHGPGVTVSPRAFAIHGGHDIALHTALRVGAAYKVLSAVERIFEKTGRSGPMTIVERRIWIEESDGILAAEIRDRQVVRWRPDTPFGHHPRSAVSSPATIASEYADGLSAEHSRQHHDLDLGAVLGPFHLRGPEAEAISDWAASLCDREVLFHDPAGSRDLGYADLVIPGPMQSAFVDHIVASLLHDWRAVQMNMTFRQSLLAGDPMAIQGIVVDAAADRRTCEIIIRHAATGETTSTGTMTLARREHGSR